MNFEKNGEILDLVVLTGSNGSGKTRILECILNCFENYINSNYQENKNRLDISFQENKSKKQHHYHGKDKPLPLS